MNAAVEGFRDLRIDLRAEPGEAAERRLHMAAGAAEPVVKIEVTERGIEVVEPHQPHHAPAEPDAFRVAGGAIECLGGFDEFVGLALIFLGAVTLLGPIAVGFGLILGVRVAALREGAADGCQRQSGNEPGDGEVAQHRILKLKHPSTHTFPDMLPAFGSRRPNLMPFKWVSNAAETLANFHDGHFEFCPAKSQLYRAATKPPHDSARSRC
jgi:hypothetical protein